MTVPTSTRAAVLTEHGEPLHLTELPLPAEVEPGAALVRVSCATLCGTDVEIWSGKMSFPGMLPMVLGHEMVGEVVAVGPGTRDALGRDIAVGARIGWSESTCGECYGCTVLREPVACSRRGYGFLQRSDVHPFATAGLCEYAYVVPRAAKLLLPDDLPDTWAAMAGCAAKTVLRAFAGAGGVTPGSRVVVQGSGALGLFATAVAHISGAGKVITVGAPASRLTLAAEFGADATVDVSAGSDGIVERVRELTGGHGGDLVMDFAGAPSVGREAVAMAAQRGRVVIVGSTGPDSAPLPLGTVMGKELTVVGSLNGDIADYHRAIEFFGAFADRMPWQDLFGTPVGLSAASDRIEAMHRLDEVKAVIDPRLP
ncbi:D-arabinose 1-dehydrogenase-like Zn-dependent alcohol dehydrogenase [Saccharothrix tamanrassetensis]|uniref:D-arabinose 1-dehydrogenase-like Zn-dependent alcohol dehydrogenase n=1 Tax=Saccharothrix tamanrassetensis TaxID=1051531 RepID=A0A841CMX5_9PSEU|nr:zinc-binding dehydrogenase [Saccharothrix tamanrassetensis]MBB5958659.1 D-arabinose 1-dehydrogenase-like Zn-dependent alcohol dehydrogenase [Saccharothrix tamanrassetensis]